MENITKYQHIIPASYIAQFSKQKVEPPRESLVSYYDKRVKKPLSNKACNILWKKWYFEINASILDEEDKINFVEEQLAKFEGKFCDIVNKNIPYLELPDEDANIILFYMFHLYLRTERKRDDIILNLNQEMSKKFTDSDAIMKHKDDLVLQWKNPDLFDWINTSEWRETIANSIHSLLVADSIFCALWNKIPNPFYKKEFDVFSTFEYQFVRIQWEEYLISWDHPVIMNDYFVAFPISKEVCLIWHKKNKPWIKRLLQEMLTPHGINCFIAENSRNIIFWPSETLLNRYTELVPKA